MKLTGAMRSRHRSVRHRGGGAGGGRRSGLRETGKRREKHERNAKTGRRDSLEHDLVSFRGLEDRLWPPFPADVRIRQKSPLGSPTFHGLTVHIAGSKRKILFTMLTPRPAGGRVRQIKPSQTKENQANRALFSFVFLCFVLNRAFSMGYER
jgi:hypothetical protein